MNATFPLEEDHMSEPNVLKKESNQSRDIMVFILVMSLAGLENLIAEIIPELELGLIEVGISTFFFVPLALVILFNSWWAAFAAPIGEIVFSDFLLGEFGGLGEFEEVFLVAVGLYVAGRIVRDPKNRMQILVAGLLAYFISEMAATFIDILKVWVGVEELEAVEGLPESIVVLEMIDFAIEFVISGVLFGALPAMALTPRLHGKIEPLMGLRPRTSDDPVPAGADRTLWIIGAAFVVLATVIAIIAEAGVSIVEWEPEFLDTIGEWFIWVAIAAAAVVAVLVLVIRARSSESA